MINSLINNTTQFSPISLKNMDEVKLMNRSDTKFTFSVQKLPILLEKLVPFYDVLEINGKRLHSYKSLYFDTDDRKFYNDHHIHKYIESPQDLSFVHEVFRQALFL